MVWLYSCEKTSLPPVGVSGTGTVEPEVPVFTQAIPIGCFAFNSVSALLFGCITFLHGEPM